MNLCLVSVGLRFLMVYYALMMLDDTFQIRTVLGCMIGPSIVVRMS